MSYKACKQSVPQWPLRAVASSHPMHTISILTHALHSRFLTVYHADTRARTQSVLLIVSPFNHHGVTADKGSVRWLVLNGVTSGGGRGQAGKGGAKEKDEGDDILKLAGCAKVTDDLMLVVTLLCHRNQVICQTPLSSPPLSSRFHLFRLNLSSPRVSSPAEKYPNYFLFWISHWPTDLAEKMKLSSQHFH